MAAKDLEIAELPSKCFHLHGVSLVVSGKPSREDWREAGSRLSKANGAVQWWIADWLRYGEKQWGEIYDEAIEITGLSYSRLRNIVYVAKSIDLSRRKDNLSFRHHELVAPLDVDEQKKWLTYALNGKAGPISMASLRRAIQESKPSDYPPWLCCSDVWNIPDCDSRFGIDYPGRIPGQVILNLLYYFGCPGGLVIDPMAGGGTVVDVCSGEGLECLAFDIRPARQDIQKADAQQPWPVKKKAGLIFIDPPYGSQQSENYSAMVGTADKFLLEFGNVMNQAVLNLRQDGHLAILISPMSIKEAYRDLPFEIVKKAESCGLTLRRRIIVPVSTQQVGPRTVEDRKKKKIMLAILRDLLVFIAES